MKAAALLATTLALVACAAPEGKPAVSAEFHGVWTNVDPRAANWWEISAERVVGYGGLLAEGKCRRAEAAILAPNLIDIRFGNAGTVLLRATRDRLLFEGARGTASHRRATRAAICRKADGSYFDGAPYRP